MTPAACARGGARADGGRWVGLWRGRLAPVLRLLCGECFAVGRRRRRRGASYAPTQKWPAGSHRATVSRPGGRADGGDRAVWGRGVRPRVLVPPNLRRPPGFSFAAFCSSPCPPRSPLPAPREPWLGRKRRGVSRETPRDPLLALGDRCVEQAIDGSGLPPVRLAVVVREGGCGLGPVGPCGGAAIPLLP